MEASNNYNAVLPGIRNPESLPRLAALYPRLTMNMLTNLDILACQRAILGGGHVHISTIFDVGLNTLSAVARLT